jgi:hypothetical protein
MKPHGADRRYGPTGVAWRVAATAGLLSLCVLSTVRGASGTFEAGSIPVANLTEQNGIISGTVRVTGNRFLVYNGTRLESMAQSMEVKFERGGSMVLCPRSQLQILTANASAGMMLAFQAGGAQEAFPLKIGDQVVTPDWRVELTNTSRTGDVGLVQVVTDRHGDLCLQGSSQPGSYFRVTPLIGDGSFQVAGGGQTERFSDGKMETSKEACGCNAEFAASANTSPMSPSGSSEMERDAALIPAPSAERREVTVGASSPAAAVSPSSAENSTETAAVKPQEATQPSAQVHKVKAKQHPQDVAGYLHSFVHMIFGR